MARSRAQKAMKLARTLGVPPEGALFLLQNQPDERGGRLFARACIECHSARGTGGEKAPRLDGLLSRAWIRSVLHPEAPENYGNAKISGMGGCGVSSAIRARLRTTRRRTACPTSEAGCTPRKSTTWLRS